jgi:hypothetical protein
MNSRRFACDVGRAVCAVWIVMLACLLLAASTTRAASLAVASPEGPVSITLRPDGATVRETVQVDLPAAVSRIHFPGIPAGADLSSIAILDRRRDVQLVDWSPAEPWQRNAMDFSIEGPAATLHFEQRVVSTNAHAARGVVATLTGRTSGRRSFDVAYRTTGLPWRIHYDVLVRGDLARLQDPVSIDVDGWVEVENATGRDYTGVSLSVVGPDTLGEPDPVRPPGILELDEDSPLADLWRFQPPAPRVPHRYEIGRGIDLPAGRAVLIGYLNIVRRPVQQRLIVRAADIPTDVRTRGAAPQRIITFENAEDFAGGRSIPPGPAAIHLGSRASLYQLAWFKHTPVKSLIQIELGQADGIFVRRVARRRVERVEGGFEQVFELRIENTLEQKAQIIIDEVPPLGEGWTLLRASHAYETRDRRIVFTPTVNAGAELVVNYTVRVL